MCYLVLSEYHCFSWFSGLGVKIALFMFFAIIDGFRYKDGDPSVEVYVQCDTKVMVARKCQSSSNSSD